MKPRNAHKEEMQALSKEIAESSLREAPRAALWRELLDGVLEQHEAQKLLEEQDIWCVPGVNTRTMQGFSLVDVDMPEVPKRAEPERFDPFNDVSFITNAEYGHRHTPHIPRGRSLFDTWLRSERPHLVDDWDAALALRALEQS